MPTSRVSRVARGLDRLFEHVPVGVDLDDLRELVAGDLPSDEQFALMAGEDLVGTAPIPRIRPILVALAARAIGASSVDPEAQHAAELLHLALRVHDFALGREGGKRRRVARRLVRSVGWITANRMTIRALELSRVTRPGVMEEVLGALKAFADAQSLARELLGEVPTEADWREHADAHTGALFAFCCRAGGHLGGARPRELSALGRYGRHVGRLWHVAEDVSILELGDPALHLAHRAQVGRPSLPVVVAAERDPSVGEAWAALAVEPDPDAARALAPRVRALGLPRSREVMLEESFCARKAVRSLPDTRYRAGMEALAAGIVLRPKRG
jgi:octaprenyl-diphosphate synthase